MPTGGPVDVSRFPLGTWINITPPGIVIGAPETCIGQGVALDFRNPGTIYWGNTPYNITGYNGLWKSTNYGVTWRRIGKTTPIFSGASDYLDMPLRIKIDPNASNHIYVVDGVRGSSQGFYVSHDGGETFVKPAGFVDAIKAAGIASHDLYEVAVDPTDFGHVLISFHYNWGGTDTHWNGNSGIMESTDAGATWKVIPPVHGWGSGHSIKFLYEPSLGLGNSKTWLVGTQIDGMWRTTDGGDHWTKVTNVSITHGGSSIYYSRNGALHTGGLQTLRSMNNGATWTTVSNVSSTAVFGDGVQLYTGDTYGTTPMQVSPESSGTSWSSYNNQASNGPFEMVWDSHNGLMFSSNWFAGLWVLRPR